MRIMLRLTPKYTIVSARERSRVSHRYRTPVFKGEAKPEAAIVVGVSSVTTLATWLLQNLSDEQLTELALQLHKVKK